MARGPDGRALEPGGCGDLTPEQSAFAVGLEGVIDRALLGHREGERFVFGIHQALVPEVERYLGARYHEAGWREVRVLPVATGAATFILTP